MRARIQACRAGQAGHAQGCLASIQQRGCLPCTQAAQALRCGNTTAVKTVAAAAKGGGRRSSPGYKFCSCLIG